MKNTKKTVALLIAILFLISGVHALGEADFREVDGDIVSVSLKSFNGYEMFEVTISAEDGNMYAYYDDGPVTIGRVHLMISCDDEVIDVINYADLSLPF